MLSIKNNINTYKIYSEIVLFMENYRKQVKNSLKPMVSIVKTQKA